MGHSMIGCEINADKVKGLKQGYAGIVEPNIETLLRENRDLCTYQTEINKSLNTCDLVFVCVGTPTKSDGSSDLANKTGMCSIRRK